MLFNGRNDAIRFVEDNGSIILEAERKANKGKELKVLISKKMLQRLLIAIAQVKAGNNSENLLNEIKRIFYSLYQSKKY